MSQTYRAQYGTGTRALVLTRQDISDILFDLESSHTQSLSTIRIKRRLSDIRARMDQGRLAAISIILRHPS